MVENAYQSFRVGIDPRIRLPRVRVLRVLQLVLFLRRKSARPEPNAGGGLDFSSFPGDGAAVARRWMVFGPRRADTGPASRASNRGLARDGGFDRAAVLGKSPQHYRNCAAIDCPCGRIQYVCGGKFLG